MAVNSLTLCTITRPRAEIYITFIVVMRGQ